MAMDASFRHPHRFPGECLAPALLRGALERVPRHSGETMKRSVYAVVRNVLYFLSFIPPFRFPIPVF